MKRFNVMVLTLVVVITAVMGCQPHVPGSNDGYSVMFEGTPRLNTPLVYHRGVQIGEIVSARAGFGNVTELKVRLNGEHQDLMTEDAVFYPAAGHLEYNRLSPAGDPLENGAPVLGFSSRLSYAWYRVKTALSSRKAAEKARALQEKIQWAEAVEIPL